LFDVEDVVAVLVVLVEQRQDVRAGEAHRDHLGFDVR
jgi:hypothetical protein